MDSNYFILQEITLNLWVFMFRFWHKLFIAMSLDFFLIENGIFLAEAKKTNSYCRSKKLMIIYHEIFYVLKNLEVSISGLKCE